MLLEIDIQVHPVELDMTGKLFSLLQDRAIRGQLESEIEAHLYSLLYGQELAPPAYVMAEIISLE